MTLLFLPVFTSYLSPSEYGIAGLIEVLSVALIAIFSLGFGTSTAVSYFNEPNREGREAVISTSFLVLAVSSGFLLVIGLPASETVARIVLADASGSYLVELGIVSTALGILSIPFSLRLQFQERARLQVLVTLLFSATTLLSSLVGVVGLGRGVVGLLEGRLVGQLVGTLMFAATFPRRGLNRFVRKVATELLRFGLPMVPSFASLFVLQHGGRYFLSVFEDVGTVGVYTVGTQLGAALGLVVSAFATAWTPYFMSFSSHPERAGEALSRVTTYYLLGVGLLCVLCFGGSRAALLVLTTEGFHDGYKVAGYAAAAQLFLGAFSVLLPACYFAKEIPYTSVLQVVAAIIAVACNLVLIPVFALSGAGLALFLGPFAMTGLLALWNRYRRESYLHVPYESGRLLRIGGFYTFLACLLVQDRAWSLAAELTLTLGTLVVTALFAWRQLTNTERDRFRSLVRNRL